MSVSIQFRWLGVAGVELAINSEVLAIDPFFTRPPFRNLLFGRPQLNRALVAEKLPGCDHILITHSHYDHLMDVPQIASNTGAHVYGSTNTCRLLRILNLPGSQIHNVQAGDRLSLGEFEVEVLPGRHIKTPLDRWISGSLPQNLHPPLRLTDYKMDESLSFRVSAGGCDFLHGRHPAGADVWFAIPVWKQEIFQKLLTEVQPRLVVPIHWDDFFRPLSKPLRPMVAPPQWPWPPLRRQEMQAFQRMVEEIASGTRVLVPEIFRAYSLGAREWLSKKG